MSVEDCLAHKWLADESPERPLALESAAVNGAGLDLHVEGEEEEEETTARDAVEQLTQEVEIKEEASMRSDEDDDDQSEECASNSDKENSLVFNTVRSINSNNTTMSSSNNSHDSSDIIFPDAPTTPKVLRKAPPDTSPGVKALVKKFQVDSVKQQMSNANEANICQSTMITSSPVSAAGALQQQQSACFVSQIPKLVNSPKSAYSNGSISRRSLNQFSPRSESPAKSIAALRSATGENRKSAGTTATLASLSAGSSKPSSPASTEPLKSPNSRYVMACVVCGEFNCRHQTTVARKSILGMEQRITC